MIHASLHRSLLMLTVAAALAVQNGCGPAGGSPTKITNRKADVSSQWSDELFNFALENLNHLEDNDCEEMLRSTQQRLAAMQQPNLAGNQASSDALLSSWPEPDMLRQVVGRLNQWVDIQEKPVAWLPDPMLATLPADLAALPMVKNIGDAHYSAYDGYMLMEAVWLRDVSRSKCAGGATADELQVACNLFDWTVRNIQTDYDRSDRIQQLPWETLFLGHGTNLERAWTYILLLRQRGIDAAMLALPVADSSPATEAAKSAGTKTPSGTSAAKQSLKPWCVGVLISDTRKGKTEKSIYLFDPKLRLPIPGPNGVVADKAGQLEIRPATLDQVVADPKLLDRLALSSDEPYWAKSADLKHAVAWIESSPLYMAPRAKRIEMRRTGDQKLVLNAEPSPQAARFKAAGVAETQMWQLPYLTLKSRLAASSDAVFQRLRTFLPFIGLGAGSLYKGRVLHLKGKLEEERGAIAYYQKARPRNRDVLAEESKHVQACYRELVTRWKDQHGGNLTPEIDQYCKREASLLIKFELDSIIGGKIDASYWLGLIQYDQGQYLSALDYFRVRVLQFGPEVPWAAGAHYNIARCYEASGRRSDAIIGYESSIFLRNDAGNILRARWLKMLDGDKSPVEKKAAPDKKVDEKKPEAKKTDVKTLGEEKAVDKKVDQKKPDAAKD
jgi:tetratricopeptide (TPR) repeat protein